MKPSVYRQLPSPTYVMDEELLIRNLERLNDVRERAEVKIILAFKAFAMWPVFDRLAPYLDGATASSLNEARLCYEEMNALTHAYSPGYIPSEFEQIVKYSSHITFNSLSQFEKYKGTVQNALHPVSMGLRINPEYAEIGVDLYNPTAKGSRLGVEKELLKNGLPEGVEGLHFHALCENNSYVLEKVLTNVEEYFGHLLPHLKWINLGGGHLITHKHYDVEHLIGLLKGFKEKYDLEIILEPGAAIAYQTGYLVSTVLDIVENHGVKTAIIDASFTCHMPDTLEMPYRPGIIGATDPVEGRPTYRIGGVSCLAGDCLSEYSFQEELRIGDRLIFLDMMQYTMVKTTTFNGIGLPSIAMLEKDGYVRIFKNFGYEDFKSRLG